MRQQLRAYQLKKVQVQTGLQLNYTTHTKRSWYHFFWNYSKQYKKRESSLTNFMRPTSSWYQNLAETQLKKKISGQYQWWTLMQKCSIKYWQTKFNSPSKSLSITIKSASSQRSKVGQHMKIYKCNPSHKQNQRQKSPEYLNRCKGVWHNSKALHTKNSQ